MSSRDLHPTWEQAARTLQSRLQGVKGALPAAVRTAHQLRRHLRAVLLKASKEETLKETQGQIEALLKEAPASSSGGRTQRQGTVLQLLGGGNKDGTRFSEDPSERSAFTRHDGAKLDFSLTVREGDQGVEILGYVFRITFENDKLCPSFLRIDMNLPQHANEEDGLRVHLHPGNNDLQVPMPWMTPREILILFLYGLTLPAKARHQQA